jgi:hypothetical protein
LHHVMVRGIERMAILLDDNDRMDVVNRIGKAAETLGLERLLAFFSRSDWYIQSKSGRG